MINISFWNILWTVVNLLVLFILFRIFFFKPIANIIAKRQEEANEIYGKIDKIVNGIYSNPIPSSKDKPSPQSTYKVTEVKVESPKPKEMSDFDLLTADVESI